MSALNSDDKKIKNNFYNNLFTFKSQNSPSYKRDCNLIPVQVTVLYMLFGCLWIAFSDKIVITLVNNPSVITRVQTFKGWFFVAVTSYMIFAIVSRGMKKTESYIEKLVKSEAKLKRINEELIKTKEQLGRNFSQLKIKEETIRLNEEKYKALVACSDSDIWEIDMENNNTTSSNGLFRIIERRGPVGYKYSLIIDDSIHCDDRDKVILDFENYIRGKAPFFHSEFRIDCRSNSEKWVLCRAKALRDVNGRITRVVGSLSDITDRKRFESKLVTMAFYDPLTDLPNRMLFSNKLNTALKSISGSEENGCVLFIDIDDFKKINDTFGHNYGDKLIKQIAEMLRNLVGRDDVICRFGGDEFVILNPKTDNGASSASLSRKILDMFSSPFELGGKHIYVTSSIGIAVYPKDGKDESTLLRKADAAMYKAKEQGKNMYCFYDRNVCNDITRKSIIEKREWNI